jgi:hypothetical protein
VLEVIKQGSLQFRRDRLKVCKSFYKKWNDKSIYFQLYLRLNYEESLKAIWTTIEADFYK